MTHASPEVAIQPHVGETQLPLPDQAQLNAFDRAREWARGKLLPIALSAGLAIGAVACGESGADTTKAHEKDPIGLAPTEACPTSWEIHDLNNAGNRLFADGIPKIWTAETDDQAREAMDDVMSAAQADPEIFAGFIKATIGEDIDPTTLADAERKCATPLAQQKTTQVVTYLAQSRMSPDQAPANGLNSGANAATGEVTQAYQPGISGDRKAIRIVGPDGKEFWVMARCGNIVVLTPIFPPGPTEEQETPPTTTTIPNTPTTTVPGPKPPTDFEYQQNQTPARQNPQNNTTSGVPVGPTPGAPSVAPPPAGRPEGDPNGGSGDGGATPEGPVDHTHGGDETSGTVPTPA